MTDATILLPISTVKRLLVHNLRWNAGRSNKYGPPSQAFEVLMREGLNPTLDRLDGITEVEELKDFIRDFYDESISSFVKNEIIEGLINGRGG